ncbi:putative protein without homology [Propionibacterium freudenreichii subsp. shermanii]|nr:putative protein without homology [Propionibacterium freudenreichii subsp. shermanii]
MLRAGNRSRGDVTATFRRAVDAHARALCACCASRRTHRCPQQCPPSKPTAPK